MPASTAIPMPESKATDLAPRGLHRGFPFRTLASFPRVNDYWRLPSNPKAI